jgi:DNA-binding NtrC family response regulator
MARILVIDDEPQICHILGLLLTERGHVVDVAASGPTALECAERTVPDLAVIDVSLPGMSGLETFVTLRERHPHVVGVFITAFGSIPSAIAAMRAGAFDYLTKPFDNDELLLTIDRALEVRQLRQEVGRLKEEIDGRLQFPGIVGRSLGIQEILRRLPKVAVTDATVLILGESGTGKELIARSLHQHSRRAAGPFVPVNCSAIPAGLVESEFFGHEKGAFTDAKEVRIGRFEQAHNGSLFLDEIGDLPLEAQAKLLRVLEEREVVRVGGRRPIPVHVRVIAATNKRLEEAVASGSFRDDLFWRLSVVPIHLPALRERVGDLPLLVQHLIDRLQPELGTGVTGISCEAMNHLATQDWPGNVRELENTLRRAMVYAEGPVLQLTDVRQPVPWSSTQVADCARLTLNETVSRATGRIERALIQATLGQQRGNRMATAAALGIDRKTLFRKMRQYGLADQDHDLTGDG